MAAWVPIDTEHNDTQHNDIQHNATQYIGLTCDSQHKGHSTQMTLGILNSSAIMTSVEFDLSVLTVEHRMLQTLIVFGFFLGRLKQSIILH